MDETFKDTLWLDEPHASVSDEEFKSLDEESQLELMKSWFDRNFEDPVHRLPYISAEGGYQYIWGGPFDASEVLYDRFDNLAAEDTIEKLVQELESDGITEWSPTESASDYDDYDEPPPPVVNETEELSTPSIGELLEAVDQLQTLIEPLRDRAAIGHNNPPSQIDDWDEFNPADAVSLSEALEEIRPIIEQGEIKPKQATRTLEALGSFISKVGNWLKARINGVLDNMLAAGAAAYLMEHGDTIIAAANGLMKMLAVFAGL